MSHSLTLFANKASGSEESKQLGLLWQEQVPSEYQGNTFFFEPGEHFDSLLLRALKDCQQNNSVLVVAGGDGTVSGVINKIAGTEQPFAVLPQGTFNFFARNNGIPLDPVAALKFALSAHPVPIDLAYLNDRPFIVNVGLGLYPKVIAARESHQQHTGRSSLTAILSGVWTLLSERHISRAYLEYNGQQQRLLTPLLMINHNHEQLQQLDPRFNTDLENLTVLRMSPISWIELLKLLANGLTGNLLDEENIECFHVDELKVDMRRSRIPIALDGELMQMRPPLRFSIRQGHIHCLLNGNVL